LPDNQPLDLTGATLSWRLIGAAGTPVLQNGDASITVVGDLTAGTIRISVDAARSGPLHRRAAGELWRYRLATMDRANSRGR